MRLGAGLEGIERRYGADPYQSVAVFRAPAPNGTLLAFMHGGGWTNGYKEWMAFMAPAFTAAGVSFATIGYRLAPAHVFPAGTDDVIAALALLHQNAAEFGYDPARIFLGGHSAGGHYAALLAVRRDWQAKAGLPQDVIRGCLPISGVYDFGAAIRPQQSAALSWCRGQRNARQSDRQYRGPAAAVPARLRRPGLSAFDEAGRTDGRRLCAPPAATLNAWC